MLLWFVVLSRESSGNNLEVVVIWVHSTCPGPHLREFTGNVVFVVAMYVSTFTWVLHFVGVYKPFLEILTPKKKNTFSTHYFVFLFWIMLAWDDLNEESWSVRIHTADPDLFWIVVWQLSYLSRIVVFKSLSYPSKRRKHKMYEYLHYTTWRMLV